MAPPENSTSDTPKHVNFDQLTGASREHVHGSGYTRFVRIMRLVLPLIALGIVIILFSVKGVDDTAISPIKSEDNPNRNIEETITRNELTNPEFRSSDKKNQPYTITALRAVQGEKNKAKRGVTPY